MRRYYHSARQLMVSGIAALPFGVGDFVMNSEFTRNVMKLSTGSAIVMALGFLITPINTRLFSPEDYGLMNMLAMVGGLFSVLLSFNLNPVILMEKHQRVADATATLSLILLPVSLTVCGGLLYLFADQLLPLLKAEAILPYLWLVFAIMGVNGLGGIVNQIIQRKKLYGFMSKMSVVGNVSGHLIRLPWGYFAPSFKVLYLSNIFAGLVPFFLSLKHGRFKLILSRRRLRSVLRKNTAFMIYQTIVGVFASVNSNLPIFWIGMKCGMVDAGYFGMAVLLIDTPCNLILNSFQTAYYKRVADTVAHEPQKLLSLYRRNTFKLFLLGLIPVVAVGIITPFIPWILGERWAPVVPILQLFLIWRLLRFVALPMTAILVVLRKNFVNSAMSVLWCGFTVWALILGGDSIVMMMTWTVFFLFFYYAVFFLTFHWLLKRTFHSGFSRT